MEIPHKSQITCLTISEELDESKSYRIPYKFKFKTGELKQAECLEEIIEQFKSTMETVEDCKRYEIFTICDKLGNRKP